MTFKDKIFLYLYNKSVVLENEKKDIDYNRRYRPMDSLDMYECMRSDIRIQCWNEFVDQLMNIVIGYEKKGLDFNFDITKVSDPGETKVHPFHKNE